MFGMIADAVARLTGKEYELGFVFLEKDRETGAITGGLLVSATDEDGDGNPEVGAQQVEPSTAPGVIQLSSQRRSVELPAADLIDAVVPGMLAGIRALPKTVAAGLPALVRGLFGR